MRGIGLATALTLAVAGTAAAQTDFERFQLFNECRSVDLRVGVSDDAIPFGLTEGRVQTLAESRLRAARLYDDSAGPYVGIYLDSATSPDERDLAFVLQVKFFKRVVDQDMFFRLERTSSAAMDALSFIVGSELAPTWEIGQVGVVVNRDGAFFMQNTSEMIDRFILEYLRVNEAACE